MILLWAHRSNATRVTYTASSALPIQYTDRNGDPVASELPQPPADQNASIMPCIVLATLDGHPILAPLRRLLRKLNTRPATATLLVVDIEQSVNAEWQMIVHDDTANFCLIATHDRG